MRRKSQSADISWRSVARANPTKRTATGVVMRSIASSLLALVVITSACAAPAARSTPETTRAAPTPSATPAPRVHVTVAMGTKGSLILLPWELAKALNYFEEANIDLELQYAANATQAAAALVAGTADLGGSSLDHSIRAQLQGKPTRMIVSFARLPGVALVTRLDRKAQLSSLAALRGTTVGVPGIASGAHVLLTYLLRSQAGLDPDRDYRVQAFATAEFAGALERGDVAAAMITDPLITQIVSSGKAALIVDLRREDETVKVLGGRYQFTGAVARADTLDKNPALVQRVVNVLVRTLRYIARAPASEIAAAMPADLVGSDRQLYVAALDASKQYLSPDGVIDRGSVETVVKVNGVFAESYPQQAPLRSGDRVDVDALFDMRFVRAASAN